MKVAVIGRSEILYRTAELLLGQGYEVPLIVTSKEAPEYSKNVEDFKKLAEKTGAIFVRAIDSDKILSVLKGMSPIDVAVSVNHNGILSQAVIDCFPCGILNAHGGDLPRYRGNACQAWALLNGEKKIGLCIHKMNGGEVDSGDIIVKEYLGVDIYTKITEVFDWFNISVPDMFLKSLNLLQKDRSYILERQSIDPADILRCYPRQPIDGAVTWPQSNEYILRLINASNRPFSGAFCTYNGNPLKIWDAVIAPDENFFAAPGQVTLIGKGFVDVACGSGKLRLLQVEYEGECLTPDELISSPRARFFNGII